MPRSWWEGPRQPTPWWFISMQLEKLGWHRPSLSNSLTLRGHSLDVLWGYSTQPYKSSGTSFPKSPLMSYPTRSNGTMPSNSCQTPRHSALRFTPSPSQTETTQVPWWESQNTAHMPVKITDGITCLFHQEEGWKPMTVKNAYPLPLLKLLVSVQ